MGAVGSHLVPEPALSTLQWQLDAHGAARVCMSRPTVFNAFDEAMIAELTGLFQHLSSRSDVRAVVLSGAGKAFSAGGDLQWMQRASQASEAWNLQDARRFADMLAAVADCPHPTIAQVHGVALGGGVGLICACDYAIASTDAQLSVSEARLGIIPSVIAPYLINAVGRRRAQQLALSAARINAADALACGLLSRVVLRDELAQAVEDLLHELDLGGPEAQAHLKRLFAQLPPGPVTAQVRELTAQNIAQARARGEAREGFAAFLDKRTASWRRRG